MSDASLLQTQYEAWIPSDMVDTLAQQLKVANSPFYTDLPSPYSDLAAHVVPSFPVLSTDSSGSDGS